MILQPYAEQLAFAIVESRKLEEKIKIGRNILQQQMEEEKMMQCKTKEGIFFVKETRNHTYSAERLLKAGAENGIPKEQMLDILEQAKYMGGSKSSLIFQMYRN